ncbi:MAG: putative Ig domain-containing protein, partial [Cyclobacteriaceae bacterium]
IPGTASFQNMGRSINKARDFNGDNRPDFIVSDSDNSYVIFGADTYPHPFDLSTLNGTNGFKVQHSFSYISKTLTSVGDFNGDGFDDLVNGTGGYPYNTFLIYGNASNPATLDLDSPAPGSAISLQSFDDETTATGIGDINGDGLHDLAISGYFEQKIQIIFGTAGLPATVDLDNIVLDGNNGFTVQLQSSYSPNSTQAGDLNGDGIDDLLINSVSGNGGQGMIVTFGSDAGFPAVLNDSDIDGDNGFWFLNPDFNYYSFGSVVTGDGDFNHDGFNDLMVADGSTLWVLFNRQGGFDEVLTTAEFTVKDGFTLNLEDYSASSVSAADFNGDGLSDIVFGTSNDQKVFLIKGNGPIAPEVASAIGDVNINEDQELSYMVPGNMFSDANPNDELSLSITYEGSGVLPAWINVDELNLALSGTPLTDADAGTFLFRVTATDEDGLTASVDFNVVVTAVNDAPVLTAIGNQEIAENSLLTFTVTAQDEESADLQYALDATSIDKGMAINVTTGVFSWTPSEAQSGSHEAIVTVSDGTNSANETITIKVNEVNVAPELLAIGNQIVDMGQELTFTAVATDTDLPANILNFGLDQAAMNKGMVINSSTGAFSWTPTPADEGNYDVTLTVSDGSLSDSETLTITVLGPLGLETEMNASISPNPVTNFLMVQSAVVQRVQIVGLDGRVCKTAITNEHIDMRDLPAGIYVVWLSDGKGVQSIHRIVKY